MLVENVVVDAAMRRHGIGERMMAWAIEEARRLGCDRLQLTSNASNTDAHRFYDRLGLTASHRGYRLPLASGGGSWPLSST
jgi:GNAT superfamily N-acetyltransferase